MSIKICKLFLSLILAASSFAFAEVPALVDPTLQLIETPNDNAPSLHCHQAIIDAIRGARSSIQMTMFHMTDQSVIQELAAAAQRNVKVQVLLDPTSPQLQTTLATLKKAGASAFASTPCFNMTHEKSFVVDLASSSPTSFIGAMNMTGEDQLGKNGEIANPSATDICESTRDLDVITHDPQIATDISSIFQTDFASAQHVPAYEKGSACPEPALPLSSPSLVLSPVNSQTALVDLIKSSYQSPLEGSKTIQCTAENWGDAAIQQALVEAAEHGVQVQIIAPQCDQNVDPHYDFDQPKTLPMLIGHPNIEVRAMPAPSTHEQPYMHSKMCRVNHSVTYVGSVNFSAQSTQKNRELGLIFKETPAISEKMDALFAKDLAAAAAVPGLPVAEKFLTCPKAK